MASKALKLPVGSWVVIALFTVSGILHLVNPTGFFWLMPPWLPEPLLLVYLSGGVELLAAGGLILGLEWAPMLAAITLLAVWPANWWFAFASLNGGIALAVAAWVRLPLQIPLIFWALKSPMRKRSETESKS